MSWNSFSNACEAPDTVHSSDADPVSDERPELTKRKRWRWGFWLLRILILEFKQLLKMQLAVTIILWLLPRIVKVDSSSFLPFPEHKRLFSNFYKYYVKQTED